MKEEDIVKKVCEIMDVKYSHYDNHKMSIDYFRPEAITSIPKIVVYSSQHGYWAFAILEDMSIFTPISNDLSILLTCLIEKLKDVELDDEIKKRIEDINNRKNKLELAEKFLKENNCALVINDTNKKINWC